MTTWFSLAIGLLGLLGFWVAEHLFRKERSGDSITCPAGFECDTVVRGPHARFLGYPVVKIGLFYYLAISAYYLLGMFIPYTRDFSLAILLVSGVAVAFSFYLTLVQLFVIKRWCTWCLFSALTTIGIFILSFLAFSSGFEGFLFSHRNLLSWIFTFFVLVGTLVTTLHAFTFVRFLRDFTISRKESRRLTMYSQTAWVALGFVFLSGLGLVLSDTYREITGNSEFLVMGIIVGALAVYELVQNTLVAPRLVNVHFGDHPKLDDHEHSYERKRAFSFAAIGLVSWYLLMLFSNLSWHEYTPMFLVGLYFGVLVVAVVISLLVEVVIYRKSKEHKE